MKRSLLQSVVFIALLAVITVVPLRAQEAAQEPQTSGSPSREELEGKIREKSQELEAINRKLETTGAELRSTQAERVSLQRELKALNQNVSQLSLNIQADEVAVQKLALEVESLGYDVRDIQDSIGRKRDAVGQVLRELQRKENQSLLMIVLKHESLADGVLESQALTNLKSQLSLDIAGLTELHGRYTNKIAVISKKKEDVELHQKNLGARKTVIEDQKEERQVVLAQTKNKETLYEQQLAELKKQQEGVSDEIGKIEDQLRAAFDVGLLPSKRPGVFLWPVQMVADGGKGRVTQHFGEKSNLYRGKPHNGLDIGVPIGTPIMAADDGTILSVDNNDRSAWSKYQYGKYILIRHPNNLATLYAHLSKQIVAVGTTVKRGDIIGYSGSTGYATGPHLHFGVYWAPSIEMKAVPPASGLVPIGVVVTPEDYL